MQALARHRPPCGVSLTELRYAGGQLPLGLCDLPLIEFTATTHPGNRYQHNEDAIGWDEAAGVWFVADGIGGHSRGDLASATVKTALLGGALRANHSLTELVMLAHEAVLLEGIERSLKNMGSTLVIARIDGARLSVAWCGDSRAYLWRAGQLSRLTRDHSLLEELLESGVVQPEEAFGHPRRNVLVQALGISDPKPAPEEISLTLDSDDLVLLCSDGVHDELPDTVIADVFAAMSSRPSRSTQAVVDELERRVLTTDARDNLSAICLRVSGLGRRDPFANDQAFDPQKTVQRDLHKTHQRIVDTRKLPPPQTSAPEATPDAISDATPRPAANPTTNSATNSATNSRSKALIVSLLWAVLFVGLAAVITLFVSWR